MAARPRLTADDWCDAALGRIADGGADAVSVEGLARELGVTKGSFYHHFADRAALVRAALERWEAVATEEVIAGLVSIREPVERLRALFRASFGDREHGPLDTALAVRSDDPVVAPVVRRVTDRRIAFLVDAYLELGYRPEDAERQARIAYAAYLGHFHLRRVLGDDAPAPGRDVGYLDQLVATLAPPVAGPAA
ncbi:MAG: TetR/AcrR family transcriptional regulator [Actinomycetota bacterium]|nr:TetR/AcrR family transcriptional regulator [Actinomycetota bacterium]